MKNKPEILIFDVNETLLDMSKIKNGINGALGSESAFFLWFSTLLEYSLAETLTGNYEDFGEVGKAVLKMTAGNFSKELSEDEISEILSTTKLPAHREVPKALEQLRSAGFRLVPLTNGGKDTLAKQLEYANLKDYFDATYSVESVKKFKPHPDPYNFVLEQEGVKKENAMLIAAHGWDILGAQRAGLQTAFISRPGKFLYPNGKTPDLSGKDLQEIADQLIKTNKEENKGAAS